MNVENITLVGLPTDENVKEYLANCVSVVRDKQPKDNEKLFNRLLKESFKNRPSRCLEFIPCTTTGLPMDEPKTPSKVYGYFDKEKYHTTARELLNIGWTWEQILPTINFENYQIMRIKAPRFVYGQLSTHTNVTSVSFSARYTDNNMGYWYPEEFAATQGEATDEELQKSWNLAVNTLSPKALKAFMKDELGIKRKEIYNRGVDSLQYVMFTLGGFTFDDSWGHLLNERTDSHTQAETQEVTRMIIEAKETK